MVMNWIVLTVEDQLVAQEGLVLVVRRCLGRNEQVVNSGAIFRAGRGC